MVLAFYFRRLGSCMRPEGGEFFLCRTFVYFSRPFWFRLEQVEEDKVQAAIMPPAPGLVLVMMGSIDTLMGFSPKVMVDTRLVISPMHLPFSRALTCACAALCVVFHHAKP